MFTQFSHFIDLLYSLWEISWKQKAFAKIICTKTVLNLKIQIVGYLKMNNGGIGTINYTINSVNKNMEGSLALFGEKGTVKIGGQYLNELEYFSIDGESKPLLRPGKPANQYGFYQGSMSNHDKVYEHLIKAIDDPRYNFIN